MGRSRSIRAARRHQADEGRCRRRGAAERRDQGALPEDFSSLIETVIASAAKQSSFAQQQKAGLLRRFAPRKKVAQKRCHTTNIEPQTFIQGGSVPSTGPNSQ